MVDCARRMRWICSAPGRWARGLAGVLAVLVFAQHASALDPSRTLTQYVHRIWQVQQGLPQASIYSIVQTHDGYLWLGTQTGLVKFDGARFTTLDELDGGASPNMWVTHLIEDDESALWIGTNQSGVIRLQHGTTARFSSKDGLPSDAVQCLFGDRRGNVWVCTPNGLAEITRGKMRAFVAEPGLENTNVHAACALPDGTIVVGTDGPHVGTWNGTRFVSRALALPASASIQSMLCTPDGAVWIGTSDGLIRAHQGSDERLTLANGLADNSVLTLTESRDGGVLVGTKNGFSRVRGHEIDTFRPSDGLSQSTVYALYEDREGSLWAGTKHGLNQFFDGRAIPYTTSEGLAEQRHGPGASGQSRDHVEWDARRRALPVRRPRAL